MAQESILLNERYDNEMIADPMKRKFHMTTLTSLSLKPGPATQGRTKIQKPIMRLSQIIHLSSINFVIIVLPQMFFELLVKDHFMRSTNEAKGK